VYSRLEGGGNCIAPCESERRRDDSSVNVDGIAAKKGKAVCWRIIEASRFVARERLANRHCEDPFPDCANHPHWMKFSGGNSRARSGASLSAALDKNRRQVTFKRFCESWQVKEDSKRTASETCVLAGILLREFHVMPLWSFVFFDESIRSSLLISLQHRVTRATRFHFFRCIPVAAVISAACFRQAFNRGGLLLENCGSHR